MTKPTIVIRISYKDWLMVRKFFDAQKGESVNSYFHRLANHLNKLKGEWDGYNGE